jgi:uncharacterized protein YjbJ (UPF0337 family)
MDSPSKDRIQGGVDELKGKAKSTWGEATGDERTRAEGDLDQLKGKAQQGLADAKEKVVDAIVNLTGNDRYPAGAEPHRRPDDRNPFAAPRRRGCSHLPARPWLRRPRGWAILRCTRPCWARDEGRVARGVRRETWRR